MQTYKAPLEDMKFMLETFGYDKIEAFKKFESFDLDVVQSILESHAKFSTQEMLPSNQLGDQQGIQYDPKNQTVKVPECFRSVYKKYLETGLAGLTHPEEFGGSGAPAMLGLFVTEMNIATNKSMSMCPELSGGLINALYHHGSEQLKKDYLPKLINGQWSGTMCLTEPHSGTDLGLMSTKAIPEGDHYKLTGTKIWITFGEHDLTENIVHLVLARLPDAPDGIRGVSLFLVPKYTLDGERNTIFCGGVEHKMGIHGSPTCVMNLEDAKGWIVGEPNKGMRAMFTMMNHARLFVGLEGVALGEIAYQTAVAFCKDRRQGRSLNPQRQDTTASADNIFVHPDIRRLLLNIKATNEGMRALASWASNHLDLSHHHPDETQRAYSNDLISLLTPVVKSYLTERGFLNINDAMQVLGGSGYTSDWCIEQYLRDARIGLIYEGTNHIQALDLVGRKLPQDNGRLFKAFGAEIGKLIQECQGDEKMTEFITPLKESFGELMAVTTELAAQGHKDPESIAAVASNYLNLFALTAIAYTWCVQVKASFAKDGQFFESKRKTASYFFKHILPEKDSLISIIKGGKGNMFDFSVEEF